MGKGAGKKRRERAVQAEEKAKKQCVPKQDVVETVEETNNEIIPVSEKVDEAAVDDMFSDSDDDDDEAANVSAAERAAELSKLGDIVKKAKSLKSKQGQEHGVVYVGHLPFGFFEEQMKPFFAQFGEVRRLKIARNSKTGKSRHYAFVEFENGQVASIVANAMNGYMMFGRTLVCDIVEPSKVHADMFKCGNRHRCLNSKLQMAEKRRKERKGVPRTQQTHQIRVQKLLEKEDLLRKKIKESGINYSFPGYAVRQCQILARLR